MMGQYYAFERRMNNFRGKPQSKIYTPHSDTYNDIKEGRYDLPKVKGQGIRGSK